MERRSTVDIEDGEEFLQMIARHWVSSSARKVLRFCQSMKDRAGDFGQPHANFTRQLYRTGGADQIKPQTPLGDRVSRADFHQEFGQAGGAERLGVLYAPGVGSTEFQAGARPLDPSPCRHAGRR